MRYAPRADERAAVNARGSTRLAAALLLAGCNNFVSSDGPNANGEKTYEYDRSLTDAMEEVVQTCRPAFDMKPGYVDTTVYVPGRSLVQGTTGLRDDDPGSTNGSTRWSDGTTASHSALRFGFTFGSNLGTATFSDDDCEAGCN